MGDTWMWKLHTHEKQTKRRSGKQWKFYTLEIARMQHNLLDTSQFFTPHFTSLSLQSSNMPKLKCTECPMLRKTMPRPRVRRCGYRYISDRYSTIRYKEETKPISIIFQDCTHWHLHPDLFSYKLFCSLGTDYCDSVFTSYQNTDIPT